MDQPLNSQPLFKHRWLIAAAMFTVLALATGGALYVRPLSGDMQAAHAQGTAAVASAVVSIPG